MVAVQLGGVWDQSFFTYVTALVDCSMAFNPISRYQEDRVTFHWRWYSPYLGPPSIDTVCTSGRVDQPGIKWPVNTSTTIRSARQHYRERWNNRSTCALLLLSRLGLLSGICRCKEKRRTCVRLLSMKQTIWKLQLKVLRFLKVIFDEIETTKTEIATTSLNHLINSWFQHLDSWPLSFSWCTLACRCRSWNHEDSRTLAEETLA